jgi:arginine N-succinyltransferase
MLIVRSVTEADLDQLFELIQKAEYGLTTLRISKSELAARIEQSVFAFSQKSAKPAGQVYVFVMEDLGKGAVVGTCSVYSKVGGFEPNYSYEIETSVHSSKELGVYKEIRILHLHEEHDGPSEIGSLFLSPDYWGEGHGRLLSIARFLFMAEFPERMETETIAEMRGVVDSHGVSPLWSALGAHFFQIDFPKADTMTARSKKFIAELMPEHPIYIPLLPESAQEVIGQVHPNTIPARALLMKEGFRFLDRVDIFDGGPTLHCATKQIRAVRESKRGTVGRIVPRLDRGNEQLISNARLNFRACLGLTQWNADQVTLNEVTALRLNLKLGDSVRCVNLRPTDGGSEEPLLG